MNVRKQYNSLDLAKFIAAILIIIIHTGPFGEFNDIIGAGVRGIVTVVAVPFFFITSGFLFFGKLNTLDKTAKKDYFKQYMKRLGVMYLLWSAVYFVFVLRNWIVEGFVITDLLIYIRNFFLKGSYSTIWFLLALMVSVAIIYFLHKKLSYVKIFLLGIPFYVIACMGSSYYGLVETIPFLKSVFNGYFCIFDTVKNGVLFGWVYVALGGIFSEIEIPKKPLKNFVLTGLFFVLLAAESFIQVYFGWAINGVDTKLLLLPLSVFLFMFVMNLDFKESQAFVWMRKLSLMMFLCQRLFLSLFEIFLIDTIFVQNSLVYFISILSLTLAFSVVFIKASEKIKILKKFY